MILKFALAEIFSANICNIFITSMGYVLISYFLIHSLQHNKSIIFIKDDTEGMYMLCSSRCLLLITPKRGVSLI